MKQRFDLVKNVFYWTEMNHNMQAVRQLKLKRNQVPGHVRSSGFEAGFGKPDLAQTYV